MTRRCILVPLMSLWWLTLLGAVTVAIAHGRQQQREEFESSSMSHDLLTSQRRRISSGSSGVCTADASVIQAKVLIEVKGRPSSVTENDIIALQDSFLETFNTQSTDTCSDEGGFRNATSVTISLETYSGLEGSFTQEFTFVADVVGACNGCDPNSKRLFQPYFRRLRRTLQENGKRRNLKSDDAGQNSHSWEFASTNVSRESSRNRERHASSSGSNSGSGSENSGSNSGSSSSNSGSRPRVSPTCKPKSRPTWSTRSPRAPRNPPTKRPTKRPTASPTVSPTASPTASPSTSPTAPPTATPQTTGSRSGCGVGCNGQEGGDDQTPSPTITSPPGDSPTLAPTQTPYPSFSTPSPTTSPGPTAHPTVTKYPTIIPTITSETSSTTTSPAPTANVTSADFRSGCKCQGVRQTKFTRYLNDAIQDIIDSVDEIEDVYELEQQCDDSVPFTNFSTTVAIAFESAHLTAAALSIELSTLQDTFKLVYNEQNALNGEICDKTLHWVTSVTMQTDFTLGRRRMRELSHGWNGTAPYNGTEYSIFFALVNGTCRGCSPSANIFAPNTFSSRRELSQGSGSSGSDDNTIYPCSCPLGAKATLPSLGTFIWHFGESIYSLIDSNALTVVGTVADVMPVKPVQCPSAQGSLNGTLQIQLETTNPLSQDDLLQLSVLFTNSFNELARRTCDPFFTNVVSAEVQHVETVEGFRQLRVRDLVVKTSLSTLIILTKAKCRGCKTAVKLFNDAIKSKVVVKKNTTTTTAARMRRRDVAVDSSSSSNSIVGSYESPYADPFQNPFRSLQWYDDDSNDDNDGQYHGHQFSHNSFTAFFSKNPPNTDVCFCDRDAIDSTTPSLTEFQDFFNSTLLQQNMDCVGKAGVITISIVT